MKNAPPVMVATVPMPPAKSRPPYGGCLALLRDRHVRPGAVEVNRVKHDLGLGSLCGELVVERQQILAERKTADSNTICLGPRIGASCFASEDRFARTLWVLKRPVSRSSRRVVSSSGGHGLRVNPLRLFDVRTFAFDHPRDGQRIAALVTRSPRPT